MRVDTLDFCRGFLVKVQVEILPCGCLYTWKVDEDHPENNYENVAVECELNHLSFSDRLIPVKFEPRFL